MSAGPVTKKIPDLRENARKFFEPQLIALGLSREQIESQSLTELRKSLESLNDAIQHPESFGVVKISMDVGIPYIIQKAKSHAEMGILPFLLEGKKWIRERISLLEKQEEIVDLREKAKSTLDQDEKAVYENQIGQLETTIKSLEESRAKNKEQLEDATRALEEAQSEAKKQELEEKRERLKLETWERRTQIWQRFLERESVATIVGGILLVVVTFFLIIATIWDMRALDILSNAFLVILGYFFGQSVGRSVPRLKEKDSQDSDREQ